MKHRSRGLVLLCVVVAVGCSSKATEAIGTDVAPMRPVDATGAAGVRAATAAGGVAIAVAGRSAAAGGASLAGREMVSADVVSGGHGAAGTTGLAGQLGAAVSGSGGMAASAAAGAAAPDTQQTLPAVTDYAMAGPFKTIVEANQGPGMNYTIYRPDPLGASGFKHSPIIFGPGIATSCAPGGGLNVYTDLLNHFASHGFVTICVNSISGGPNAPGNLTAMQMGLEWLIEQNSQTGVFAGKLAVDRAVAMGYSIGATASTQLSSHAAIITVISIHGHNTMGDPHGPIWLVTGTMDVIDDNRATLKTLAEAPAVLSALPIGHLDVPAELGRGGKYIAPLTAWLRYWVNGDQGAKHYILGPDCETCKSPWITPESNERWKAQP